MSRDFMTEAHHRSSGAVWCQSSSGVQASSAEGHRSLKHGQVTDLDQDPSGLSEY